MLRAQIWTNFKMTVKKDVLEEVLLKNLHYVMEEAAMLIAYLNDSPQKHSCLVIYRTRPLTGEKICLCPEGLPIQKQTQWRH